METEQMLQKEAKNAYIDMEHNLALRTVTGERDKEFGREFEENPHDRIHGTIHAVSLLCLPHFFPLIQKRRAFSLQEYSYAARLKHTQTQFRAICHPIKLLHASR